MEKWKLKNYYERNLSIFEKQTTENTFVKKANELLSDNNNEDIIGASKEIIKYFESKLNEDDYKYAAWFAERGLIDIIMLKIINECIKNKTKESIDSIKKMIDIIKQILPITIKKSDFYQCTYYRRLLGDFYLILHELEKDDNGEYVQNAQTYYQKGYDFFDNERRDAPQMHILILHFCTFCVNYNLNNKSIIKIFVEMLKILTSHFDEAIENLDTGGVGEGSCESRYKQNTIGLQMVKEEIAAIKDIGNKMKNEIVEIIKNCHYNDGNVVVANTIDAFMGDPFQEITNENK